MGQRRGGGSGRAALPPEGAGSGAGFDELVGVGEEDVVRAGAVVCAEAVELGVPDWTEASWVDEDCVVAACVTDRDRAGREAFAGFCETRRAGCDSFARSCAVGGLRVGAGITFGEDWKTVPPGESRRWPAPAAARASVATTAAGTHVRRGRTRRRRAGAGAGTVCLSRGNPSSVVQKRIPPYRLAAT